MTKSDLLAKVAAIYPYISIRNVDRVVSILFDKIIDTLKDGGRVELRGFGTFSIRKREATVGRNPRTGELVNIAKKSVPFFKPGKQLKEYVNGVYPENY